MTKKEESPTEPATTSISPDMKRNTNGPPSTTQSQTNKQRALEAGLSNKAELTFDDNDDDDDDNEPTYTTLSYE